jgi:hypothetical protein
VLVAVAFPVHDFKSLLHDFKGLGDNGTGVG